MEPPDGAELAAARGAPTGAPAGYTALGATTRSRRAPAALAVLVPAALSCAALLAWKQRSAGGALHSALGRAELQVKAIWCEELAESDQDEEPSPLYWMPDMSGGTLNITVLTYNLEKDTSDVSVKPFESRGRQDIMGFQACPDARKLVKFGVSREDVVFQGKESLCMCYKNDTFSLVSQGLEDVAEDGDDGSEGEKQRRGVQWMRLNHKSSGKHVFFANHYGPLPFDSGGACGAENTARNLLKLVRLHSEAGDVIILAGDLNVGTSSKLVQGIARRLTRVFVSEPGTSSYIFTNVGGKGGSNWAQAAAVGARIEEKALAGGGAATPAQKPENNVFMGTGTTSQQSASKAAAPDDASKAATTVPAPTPQDTTTAAAQSVAPPAGESEDIASAAAATVPIVAATTTAADAATTAPATAVATAAATTVATTAATMVATTATTASTTATAVTTTLVTATTVTTATETTTTTTLWCNADIRKTPERVWRAAAAAAAVRFKVLSANLIWWNVEQHVSHADLLESIIRSTGDPYMYDAIGLQECKEPKKLVAKLGKMGKRYKIIHGVENGLCTIYRSDDWTEKAHGEVAVAVDKGSVDEEDPGNRSVQWARLTNSETGQPFFFMNFHGPLPLNTGGRCGGENVANRIVGAIAQHAQEGDAVVVSGAFNAKGFTPLLQSLQQRGLNVFKVSNDGTAEFGTDFILSNVDAGSLVTSANMGSGGRFHDVLGAIFEVGKRPNRPDGEEESAGIASFYTWTTSSQTTTTSTSTRTATTTSTTSTVTGPQPFECPKISPALDGPLWSTTGKPSELKVASLWLGRAGAGEGLSEKEDWNDYDVVAFQGCSDPDQLGALGEAFGVVIHRYGLCLAYQWEKWSVVSQGVDVVAEDSDSGPSGKRGAQWVRLAAPDGRSLVLVNHDGPAPFDSGGKCGGEATAQGLLGTIVNAAEHGDAVVLAGRFNAGSASDTISQLQLNFPHVCTREGLDGKDQGGQFIFSNGQLEVQSGSKGGELGAAVTLGSMIVTSA